MRGVVMPRRQAEKVKYSYLWTKRLYLKIMKYSGDGVTQPYCSHANAMLIFLKQLYAIGDLFFRTIIEYHHHLSQSSFKPKKHPGKMWR